MPTFEHDSLTFNYIDTGDPDGRPFVLQHGMGGDVPISATVPTRYTRGAKFCCDRAAKGSAKRSTPIIAACAGEPAMRFRRGS